MGTSKAKQNLRKNRGETVAPRGEQRFRLLAYQPLSVVLETSGPFSIRIGGIDCSFFVAPVHESPSAQRSAGGSWIHVEFILVGEDDLLRAASKGLQLVEDLLSGLAVVAGPTFQPSSVFQIVDITIPRDARFLLFLSPRYMHWDLPVSDADIISVRKLLAHWDGLTHGNRIRRAARLYRQAIGLLDALSAFQSSYMGLESLEQPLATMLGVEAGVEEVRGNCENCGAEFVRRRTTLNAVRAYIRGDCHPDGVIPEREQEWRLINDLRQKLFHSLVDPNNLQQQTEQALPAALHFLHDAICCLSHAHTLESPGYSFIRSVRQAVMCGWFRATGAEPLNKWGPVFDLQDFDWVPHPRFGVVPQFSIRNERFREVRVASFWLGIPLGLASESDLMPAETETDS